MYKNFRWAMLYYRGLAGLGMEYFCFEQDGMWRWSDAELLDMGRRELVALGICRADEVKAGMVYRQPKAYPVYDGAYLEHVAVVREWLQRALPNLWLVGRNGMHHYNNQDHSMMTGILVARNIATGAHYDPWLVNTCQTPGTRRTTTAGIRMRNPTKGTVRANSATASGRELERTRKPATISVRPPPSHTIADRTWTNSNQATMSIAPPTRFPPYQRCLDGFNYRIESMIGYCQRG